jgi:glyoxylase-like metal-dependent hydrolase (beta-lactamase superfamily II)
MIEEILKNLYRIEIPLPGSPLNAVNSYLIKAPRRNLIIDTGMNRKECLKVMQIELRKLGVDLRRTDFFITHIHADHLGLISSLTTNTSTIYFNQPDAELIRSNSHWIDLINSARLNGFPENELGAILRNHPGYKYGPRGNIIFTILKQDDIIQIGDYGFKCIETPGHTKGHMCLYEPNQKIFVAGDHIINDITPNIRLWSEEGNPLKEYLASLDKVYDLDIKLILPGHRGIFKNYKERIQELRNHHQQRAKEVLYILERGWQNAFQVASQMKWDVSYPHWDLFPPVQKWFATGETIAHLKYLEEKKIIQREMRKQKIEFSL